ncbi:MAG: hypothetical protein WD186_04505 [Actinomycetota bacterium]
MRAASARSSSLNPRQANAAGDADHDGLRNIGEFRNEADPTDEDSDNDGIDDGDEVGEFDQFDVGDSDSNDNGVEDGDQDADHDGQDNEDEDDADESCKADDDDSDEDGVEDEDENDLGTKVGDDDSDNDGVEDGNEDVDGDGIDEEDADDADEDECSTEDEGEDADDLFGTIVSFEAGSGVLTVDLASGGQVSGTVTGETELAWDCDEEVDEFAPTAEDLVPGTKVTDFEDFPETVMLEEVELLRPVV